MRRSYCTITAHDLSFEEKLTPVQCRTSRRSDDDAFYGLERKVCKKTRNESDYSDDKVPTIKARCSTMNFYCMMADLIIIPGRCFARGSSNNWMLLRLAAWLQLESKGALNYTREPSLTFTTLARP